MKYYYKEIDNDQAFLEMVQHDGDVAAIIGADVRKMQVILDSGETPLSEDDETKLDEFMISLGWVRVTEVV